VFSASRCLSWPHHFLRGSRRRPAPAGVSWDSLLTQPSDWYSTPEATRIAGNLLPYQRDTGGWPKNIDMTAVVTSADRARLTGEKDPDRFHDRQRCDHDRNRDARPRVHREPTELLSRDFSGCPQRPHTFRSSIMVLSVLAVRSQRFACRLIIASATVAPLVLEPRTLS